MATQLNVSIGIAAYNAEDNIDAILDALLKQAENAQFRIREIIVHCDNCTDNTVKVSQGYSTTKVRVIDNKKRKGFAGSIKALFKESSGDILMLFNDDIKITDSNLLAKLLQPFVSLPNIGFVTGRPVTLPPRTFIEKAKHSTDMIYDKVKYKYKNGQTATTVDGKVMAFSKDLINAFVFPADLSVMGCVDAYLYFAATDLGFKYAHVQDAIVYGKNPDNLSDYISFHARNFSNVYSLKKVFGADKVAQAYYLPKASIARYSLQELIKNPLGVIFALILKPYINRQAQKTSRNFNIFWDSIESSKHLS